MTIDGITIDKNTEKNIRALLAAINGTADPQKTFAAFKHMVKATMAADEVKEGADHE